MPCSLKAISDRCLFIAGLLLVLGYAGSGVVCADTLDTPEDQVEIEMESLEDEMRDLEDLLDEESEMETTITLKKLGGAVRISHSTKDVVQVGSSVVIDEDTHVRGDVVAVGGSATVYGLVDGDVVAIGGNVRLHDGVVVLGDAVAIGGRVIRDDGAKVRGETVSIAPGVGAFFPWSIGGEPESVMSRIGGVLLSIFVSWMILFVFAALFVGLISKPTDRVAASIRRDPLKAGFAGFLVFVLSPFVVLILTISIIGIPLIPIYFAMLTVAIIWGLVVSALEVGRGFGTKLYSDLSKPVVTAIVGIILLTLPKFLGKMLIAFGGPLHIIGWSVMVIGFLILGLAVVVGMGGILFTRFGRRDGNGGTAGTAGIAEAEVDPEPVAELEGEGPGADQPEA